MERINALEPVFLDTLPENDALEYGKIYISRRHGISKHLCPDGCGTVSVLTFGGADGWKLTESDGRIMVHPSVLETMCPHRAHYFITYNRIQWL